MKHPVLVFGVAFNGILFMIVIFSWYYSHYKVFFMANNNPSKSESCQNICKVNQLPNRTVKDFASLSLDKSTALFVHFHGKSLSSLKPPENTDILDPVNLVWVESITAPFLSLDLDFNVYSLTTLWRKVRNMSIMVDFESPKCLQSISYSCMTASLATAFLTNVSHQRGALCYVIKAKETKYRCCIRDFHTDEIKCDVPASISQSMSGIFNAVAIVGAMFFLCFPAIFFSFPEEVDSSQTVSANTQVRNPLYRIANFAVQNIRLNSSKYYFANVLRKLLIAFSLPILFYIHWGLVAYTAKYDIPKMFNDAVRNNWYKTKLFWNVLSIVVYGTFVLIASLMPPTENLNFSHLPSKTKRYIQERLAIIRQTVDHELDWKVPYFLATKCLIKCCSGFKVLLNHQTSPCWRITNFLFSCFLISIFPIISVLVFIGYGWFISPLGRKFSILHCYAIIYQYWFMWFLDKKIKITKCSYIFHYIVRAIITCGVYCVLFFLFNTFLMISILNIISSSLILISRLITYFYTGIVASKDDFLPIIALFSLFAFYIWGCFSSVENTYEDLLDQTFDKCKEYQEETKREIIKIDNKGVPRIEPLRDLFQKVVDEIQPFSMAYTKMCLTIAIIGCFLFLTYYSILVYGNTSLNDLTKTLAVSLAGLIPKLIEIFRTGRPKKLVEKENVYRVKKIVYDFFTDTENTQEEVATHTEINSSDDHLQPGKSSEQAGNQSVENSRSSPEIQSHQQIVHADVNPRWRSINNDDTGTETTPLLHSHQKNYTPDLLEVV